MPEAIPLPPFFHEVLKGIGQVVFCQSSLTGSCVLLGLAIGDYRLAALTTLGCASATAAARVLGANSAQISEGRFGYNGALLGCTFKMFLMSSASWKTFLALASAMGFKSTLLGLGPLAPAAALTVLGGAATAPIAIQLGKALSPIPQWTWAFNLVALTVLLCVQPLRKPPPEEQRPLSPEEQAMAKKYAARSAATWGSLDPVDWAETLLHGLSQIFVVQNSYTGLLVLLGIAAFSPQLAGCALAGSAVGAVSAFCTCPTAERANAGLWGSNPALTALAVAVFFVPTQQAYYLAAAGGVGAAMITAGLYATLREYLDTPPLQVGFCAAATACFLSAGRFPGLIRARATLSPEANMRGYYGS